MASIDEIGPPLKLGPPRLAFGLPSRSPGPLRWQVLSSSRLWPAELKLPAPAQAALMLPAMMVFPRLTFWPKAL